MKVAGSVARSSRMNERSVTNNGIDRAIVARKSLTGPALVELNKERRGSLDINHPGETDNRRNGDRRPSCGRLRPALLAHRCERTDAG